MASAVESTGVGSGGGLAGCGNGVLDEGEACDLDSELCVDCQVLCPPGWERAPSGTRCFAPLPGDLGYFDAASACATVSLAGVRARLATPRTTADLDAAASLCPQGTCYIGANDLADEGSFRWVDGVDVDAAAPWGTAQPDDLDGRQDCLVANAGFGTAILEDVACDLLSGVMCEILPGWAEASRCGDSIDDPGEECQPNEKTCEACNRICSAPNGLAWQESPLGSHLCLRTDPAGSSFVDAGTFCSAQGGRLATPDDLGALEVARYVCDGGGETKSCWLGGTDSRTEGSFIWSDGAPVDLGDIAWQPDQPNGGTAENCLSTADALLADSACDIALRPLCERAY